MSAVCNLGYSIVIMSFTSTDALIHAIIVCVVHEIMTDVGFFCYAAVM